MVEPCLSLDADQPVAALLKRVSQAPEQKGVVLIRDGRFVATLDPAQLAQLAMHREVERASEGTARAGTVEEAAPRSESDVAALTATLPDTATWAATKPVRPPHTSHSCRVGQMSVRPCRYAVRLCSYRKNK